MKTKNTKIYLLIIAISILTGTAARISAQDTILNDNHEIEINESMIERFNSVSEEVDIVTWSNVTEEKGLKGLVELFSDRYIVSESTEDDSYQSIQKLHAEYVKRNKNQNIELVSHESTTDEVIHEYYD